MKVAVATNPATTTGLFAAGKDSPDELASLRGRIAELEVALLMVGQTCGDYASGDITAIDADFAHLAEQIEEVVGGEWNSALCGWVIFVDGEPCKTLVMTEAEARRQERAVRLSGFDAEARRVFSAWRKESE